MSNPIGSASFAQLPAASSQANSPGITANNLGAAIQMPAGANATFFNGLLEALQNSLGGLKMGSSVDTAVHSSPYTTAAAGTPGEPTSVTVNGTTLTQAGYVSPVLLQQFSDSLFQALQSGGLGGSGAAAGTGNASSVSYQGGLASTLQNLIQESGTNGGPDSDAAKLQAAFDNLMKNSGIAVTSGMAANGTIQPSGLQTFLNGLLANVQSGRASSSGLNVNATA